MARGDADGREELRAHLKEIARLLEAIQEVIDRKEERAEPDGDE